MVPSVPETAQAPGVLAGSTVKVTGLPDAPPVAVRVAWPPTVPVPGPVKLIACAVRASSSETVLSPSFVIQTRVPSEETP